MSFKNYSKNYQKVLPKKNMHMKLPANVLLFKFNNKNSRIRFEVCSKLTIKNNFIDVHCTKKMKISIKNFFSKCDQIRIWSYLLKKSLMENFIFLCSGRPGVFIVDFEYISYFFLVYVLLASNRFAGYADFLT